MNNIVKNIVKNVDFKLDLYTKDKIRIFTENDKVCDISIHLYIDTYINDTKFEVNSFENLIEILKALNLLDEFIMKAQELVTNFQEKVKEKDISIYDPYSYYYGDVNITYYSGNYLAIVIAKNGGIDNVVKRWEQFLEEFL